MDKILSDWLKHNLRKNRPYINFTFESDELLLDSINMLDMSGKEAKYIEGYNNEDFEKSRLEYVNYSMNNIKNVLEHLFNDDTIITVYSNKNFFITPFANLEDYSLNYLKSKLNNIIEDEKTLIGNCNYNNMIDLIYSSIIIEHGVEDDLNKIVPLLLLFEFDDYVFYVYDARGGILITKSNDKEKLKYQFFRNFELNPDVINGYWLDDMKNILQI